MDANGQRFWLLADDRHWPGRSHVDYRAGCRALRLASERSLPAAPVDAAAIAAAALERLPRAVDRHGASAHWDDAEMAIVAVSHLPAAATLLPLAERPQDFAAGFDDVLYVALGDRLLLHDLRGRWPDTVLPTPTFQAWRIAVDPLAGVWL
ncbi:MAG: phage tail protein, partial [Candidatus Accumulibacter sp.]|nr:phage tail protein [Accumulibacter sp.]